MQSENEIVVVTAGGAEVATWMLPHTVTDLSLVDDVARLVLAARRCGYTIRLRNPCAGLLELIDLAGLAVEVLGKPEAGEQVGVEEVVMPDDPVA